MRRRRGAGQEDEAKVGLLEEREDVVVSDVTIGRERVRERVGFFTREQIEQVTNDMCCVRTCQISCTLLFLFIAFIFIPALVSFSRVSNGYGAKVGCSLVFVSKRSMASALKAELLFPPIRFVSKMNVDYKNGYDPIVPDIPETPENELPDRSLPFPYGDSTDNVTLGKALEGVDIELVGKTVRNHFWYKTINARAFVLVKDDQIIYETYGDEANADMPLLGWSMTKSVLQALIGILIQRGKLPQGLDTRINLHEWEGDARTKLTLRDLLTMSDGFDFDEFYYPASDTPDMLFVQPSVFMPERKVRFHPIIGSPHHCHQYSSFTTNVLSRFMMTLFDTHEEYLRFPTEALFRPLGMESFVLETDPAGIFIGSSFAYGTARDWTRFGLLFLHDGVWNGQRILPEGWVDFTRNSTFSSEGVYGSHFWLGGGIHNDDWSVNERCNKLFPSRLLDRTFIKDGYPPGSFLAHGFEEQALVIVPKHNVVLLRMGATKAMVVKMDKIAFYKTVLEACGVQY